MTLPDEALLAQLTFYLYPVTGEETAVAAPPANPESLTTGDAQYVLLYGDGGVLLETLYWDLSNAQAWQSIPSAWLNMAGRLCCSILASTMTAKTGPPACL
ncbi:MAG: hypothetical protein M5U34_14835 [Chloroflexi bacterium]|nr:hypothetical protein [Chloroflexota bacterium]